MRHTSIRTFLFPSSQRVDRKAPEAWHEPVATPVRRAAPRPEPLPGPTARTELAADVVHQIREILQSDGDFLKIPARALLLHLPEALRGPTWLAHASTGIYLLLEKEALLKKLRSGSLTYRLGEFLPDLPEGWAADMPDAEVKLDLPTVVSAIPQELLQSEAEDTSEAAKVAGMRDYFAPQQTARDEAGTETPPIPEPAARPAQSSKRSPFAVPNRPKRVPVPPRLPDAWNGIEAACHASVAAVDINEATFEELQKLPGVGPARARMILTDRVDRGPFDGIYDLLRIRGVGRKRFRQITGLSLRRCDRRDRHEVLSDLIGLPKDYRPPLPVLIQQISTALSDATCTLAADDGMLLASSVPPGSGADMQAALVPMLFRRSRRYLRDLAPGAREGIVLPLSDPPMLLFAVDRFFLIVQLGNTTTLEECMPKALAITHELKWLLGPRAIVR